MMVFVQKIVASDFSRLYVGAIEPQYQLASWYDIPYYKGNSDTYRGRVSYHNIVYDNVQLRFDQLKQRISVLSPEGQLFILPEKEYINWFEMDGHRYVLDPEDTTRYASLLCDGSTNGIRLYHSEWKVLYGEKTFEGKKYQKVLRTKEHYMLITPDGAQHQVKRASDVAKLFPEQQKQIRQFAKKNRLSFTKKDREGSLVRLVESILGLPIENNREEYRPSVVDSLDASNLSSLNFNSSSLSLDGLVVGIPVLDSAMTVVPTKRKVYVVPGVKKAKASIADDHELAEVVVVGGRQSAVEN